MVAGQPRHVRLQVGAIAVERERARRCVELRLIGIWEVKLRLAKEARSATLGHTRKYFEMSKVVRLNSPETMFAGVILHDDEYNSQCFFRV